MNLVTIHIDTERTWRGGEAQALHLVRGLQRAGGTPIVVGQPGSPFVEKARAAGVETAAVRMRGEADLLAAMRIGRLARWCSARILHAHTAHAGALALLAAKVCRARVVIARRVDFPVRGAWKYGKGVSRILAISEAVRSVLIAGGVEPGRISVVHSGIDIAPIDEAAPIDIRAEFGLEASAFVIGNVAHFADHKGQCDLVDAMALVLEKHREARLVFVGDGELRESLAAQAKRLGIGQAVVFAGFRNDVPGLLKALDLFVMSSRMEGLCTSLMDAMAARRPIVATRAGGIPEVVTDGQDGILAPPRDPASLAKAIVSLIEDRALAGRLAENARGTVERKFSAQAMVEGTLAVYREILGL